MRLLFLVLPLLALAVVVVPGAASACGVDATRPTGPIDFGYNAHDGTVWVTTPYLSAVIDPHCV